MLEGGELNYTLQGEGEKISLIESPLPPSLQSKPFSYHLRRRRRLDFMQYNEGKEEGGIVFRDEKIFFFDEKDWEFLSTF